VLNHTVFLTLQNLTFFAFAVLFVGYLLTGPRAIRIVGIILAGVLYLIWDPSTGLNILIVIAGVLLVFEILAHYVRKLKERFYYLSQRRVLLGFSILGGLAIGILPFLDYFVPG